MNKVSYSLHNFIRSFSLSRQCKIDFWAKWIEDIFTSTQGDIHLSLGGCNSYKVYAHPPGSQPHPGWRHSQTLSSLVLQQGHDPPLASHKWTMPFFWQHICNCRSTCELLPELWTAFLWVLSGDYVFSVVMEFAQLLSIFVYWNTTVHLKEQENLLLFQLWRFMVYSVFQDFSSQKHANANH